MRKPYQLVCKNTSEAAASSYTSVAKNTVNAQAVNTWTTCKPLKASGPKFTATLQYDMTRGGMPELTVTLGWVPQGKDGSLASRK
jgi:hypothetical protein